MFAVIAWSTKNGVALGREELEVVSTSKLTVMNGGKMEAAATVNMLFRKDIWGGTIHSVHGKIPNYTCRYTFVRQLYHYIAS